MTFDDAYSILNVYPDCSLEEAREAYRTAALKHHPDRHPPHRRTEAERRFKVFANAYLTICKDLGHELEAGELNPPKTISGLADTPGALALRQAARYARQAPSPAEQAAIAAAARSPRSVAPSAQQHVSKRDPRLVARSTRPQYRQEVHDEPEEEDEEEDEDDEEDEDEEDDEEDEEAEYDQPSPPRRVIANSRSAAGVPARRSTGQSVPSQRDREPQRQRQPQIEPQRQREAYREPPRQREVDQDRYDGRRDARAPQHPVRRAATEPALGSNDNWMQPRSLGKNGYDNNNNFFNGGGAMTMPPMGGGMGGGLGGGTGMGMQMSLGTSGGDPFAQITGMIDNMSKVNIQDAAFGRNGGGQMHMRSSRMTMSQGDGGEWKGQKHNRAMKVGNGQMDVSEDGTELYMPSLAGINTGMGGQGAGTGRQGQTMQQQRDGESPRARQVKAGPGKSARSDAYDYQDAPPAYRAPEPQYDQQEDHYEDDEDEEDDYPEDDYDEPAGPVAPVRRSTAPAQTGQRSPAGMQRRGGVPLEYSLEPSVVSTPSRGGGGRGYAGVSPSAKALRDSESTGSPRGQQVVRGGRGESVDDRYSGNAARGGGGAIEAKRGERRAIEAVPIGGTVVKRGGRGPVARA